MRYIKTRRHFGCESLESRTCLSGPGFVLPASVVPIQRTDFLSNVLYLDDATEAAVWHPNVVVLGDSIPYFWAFGSGSASWAKTFGPLFTADFAVPGNKTQNVLWQIDTGALQNRPKVVVLSIGLNNLANYDSVDNTIAGIVADVEAIRGISPTSKIMLTGILPFQNPPNGIRFESVLVNNAIATVADGVNIVYTNPGANMIFPDGSIDGNFLPDLTHPNANGYTVWGSVIISTLDGMVASFPPAPSSRS